MGLGPPTCGKCRMIMRLTNDPRPRSPSWQCPKCGLATYYCERCRSTDPHKNLWELSKEDQILYEKNSEDFRNMGL